MSKPKGDALYIYHHGNGILLAQANQSGKSLKIDKIVSITDFSTLNNLIGQLEPFRASKKGFCEVHVVLSHPSFRYLYHVLENPTKVKSPDYIPDLIKGWIGGDQEDFYFHVIDWQSGETVPHDQVTQKHLLVSGMKTEDLVEFQDDLIEKDYVPSAIESSIILTIGVLRKQIALKSIQAPILLLEIHEKSSTMVIIPIEGNPMFLEIASGEDAMYEAVRSELSLKDVSSAKKLIYSSTIDLSDIGRQILNPVYKEIAANIGLFEVDTGQSVAHLIIPNVLPNHQWMAAMLAKDLGMELFQMDLNSLGSTMVVSCEEGLEWDKSDSRIIPLVSAMGVF